ncbi:MAG: transcription termination/antitermination protein NusG [Alphaproteobacteria bacterium]
MKRWYVVHTHPGAEAMAEGHLARQGFETYLPRCAKERRHARRIDRIAVPLFPRYLFVAVDMERQRWRAIQSTFGVATLVSFGDRPAAVPEGVVEDIRGREGPDGLVPLPDGVPFAPGERVEIADGAFAEQSALFQTMDGTQRVVVLLKMLGRDLRVRVPRTALRACG